MMVQIYDDDDDDDDDDDVTCVAGKLSKEKYQQSLGFQNQMGQYWRCCSLWSGGSTLCRSQANVPMPILAV